MQTHGQIRFHNANGSYDPNTYDHLTNPEQLDKKRRAASVSNKDDEAKSSETNRQKFEKLVESSNQFIYSIRTHMPLDLFPNHLIIDIHKVTYITDGIIYKDSLIMPIRDINKVEVSNNILFASLELINGSQTTTISVHWLKKDEAREAQAIIQGLMIGYKNDINLEEFEPNELLTKILTLGTPVTES